MDPIDLLPDAQAKDVRAIIYMHTMIYEATDIEVRKDLGNRIAQARGRLAAWEQANPELANKIALAAEAQAT